MRSYLIVDDNLALAENLAEIIHDAGDSVTLAQSGAEALQLAKAQRFDALVTDMRMPAMSGADLIGHLAELDSELPVIVVTAFTSDDHLSLARRYGVLSVLPKPVPIDRLLKLVHIARRGGRVAIVEDDEALAENLSEALSESGFATVVAPSLEEAKCIGARPFAAVIDLRLPGGPDGKCAELLRSQYPCLPLLVISGLSEGAAPAEISGFFAKPFKTGEVLSALDRLYASRGHANESVAPS